MAGLEATPLEVGGIENVDLKDIIGGTYEQGLTRAWDYRYTMIDLHAYTGHFDIAEKMPVILEEIGVDR